VTEGSATIVLADRATLIQQMRQVPDPTGAARDMAVLVADKLAGQTVTGGGIAVALMLGLSEEFASLQPAVRASMIATACEHVLPDLVSAIVPDGAVRDAALGDLAAATGKQKNT
jgi:hypothetical protein